MPRRWPLGLILLLTACATASPGGNAPLERFAGTWEVSVWDAAGNPIPGHTIVATPTATGWSQSFPERQGIPVRPIEGDGDLVVFEAGPYESVLRAGVRVTVLYVTRFEGDRSEGSLLAWYESAGPPIPVLRGRTQGRRVR